MVRADGSGAAPRRGDATQAAALGGWIRDRRAAAAVSQRELADRAGLSRSYLCDIERGRGKQPSIATLHAIADGLEVDRVDLLRVAGVLDAPRGPEEASRERRLLAVYRSLGPENQEALERFGRFLLHEEQRWVQPALVDADERTGHGREGRPAGMARLFELDGV